ncbi:MAG: hypothetical protein NW208_06485 [Bryobacter sp.]|nr:hypothetical protein [Bryobacter sp.]
MRSDLAQLQFCVEHKDSSKNLVDCVHAVCLNIRLYFQKLSLVIDTLASDLELAVRSLDAIVLEISGDQDTRFERMEQHCEKLSTSLGEKAGIDDLQRLRGKFEVCVKELRVELKAQREAQNRHKEALGTAVGALRQASQIAPMAFPEKVFAVLRLQSLNRVEARLGAKAAQSMLEELRQILKKKWPTAVEEAAPSSHAILLVDKQDLDLEKHRQAIRRLVAAKLTLTISLGDRDHLLPLHLDWLVAHAHSPEQMQKLVENFLAGNSAGKV